MVWQSYEKTNSGKKPHGTDNRNSYPGNLLISTFIDYNLEQGNCRQKDGMDRESNIVCSYRYHLIIAVFLEVLLLNSGAEVKGCVVYEIRRVLRQIQEREIEIQAHHAFPMEIQDHLRVETNGP